MNGAILKRKTPALKSDISNPPCNTCLLESIRTSGKSNGKPILEDLQNQYGMLWCLMGFFVGFQRCLVPLISQSLVRPKESATWKYVSASEKNKHQPQGQYMLAANTKHFELENMSRRFCQYLVHEPHIFAHLFAIMIQSGEINIRDWELRWTEINQDELRWPKATKMKPFLFFVFFCCIIPLDCQHFLWAQSAPCSHWPGQPPVFQGFCAG